MNSFSNIIHPTSNAWPHLISFSHQSMHFFFPFTFKFNHFPFSNPVLTTKCEWPFPPNNNDDHHHLRNWEKGRGIQFISKKCCYSFYIHSITSFSTLQIYCPTLAQTYNQNNLYYMTESIRILTLIISLNLW